MKRSLPVQHSPAQSARSSPRYTPHPRQLRCRSCTTTRLRRGTARQRQSPQAGPTGRRESTPAARSAGFRAVEQHRCLRFSGTDSIHANAVGGQLKCRCFCHPPDRPFGSHVGKVVFEGDQAGGRTDVHDRATAGVSHRRDNTLHAQERTNLVHIDDRPISLLGGTFGPRRSENAGVIDQDCRRPESDLAVADNLGPIWMQR